MLQLTRRKLLKSAAAAGLATSIPLKFSMEDYSKAAAESTVEIRPTLCNGCSNLCGLFIHVKNGRVWRAEGHPIHLKNQGTICARGHGMISDIYNPDRITQPMKRVGEEKFEPISWDQAFKEIGEKLTDIMEKHSGNAITWLEHGPRGKEYADIFLDIVGSPNYITHYATCFTSKTNAWNRMVGTSLFGDHENADYMLFAGRNFAGGILLTGMQKIIKAKDRGAKLVVIDPRFCELAGIADEWVPIKPGTDLAFFLAMAHVLITEDLMDRKFVREYVEGFDEFWNANRNRSPEWAQEITGISADKIREIARDMAEYAPKAFLETGYHGLHAHYQNSLQQAQMNVIINTLLGNMYQRGGLLPPATLELGSSALRPVPMKEKGSRVDGAGERGPYTTVETARGIPQRVPQLVEEGKIKALFVYHYNPLRTGPDPEYQKKMKNADLVVNISIDWNETALYTADYILPECYFMERDELPVQTAGHVTHDYPQLAMRTKVVEPLGDSKPLIDIMKGIAEEIGAREYFDFTVDEQVENMIRPLGITLEQLKKAGCLEFRNRGITPVFPMSRGEPDLTTPTGKIEFSVGLYKANGFSGVPRWVPPRVEPKARDEFRLIHGKQPWHSHHITSNNKYLMAMTEKYHGTRMWINKRRADELGIKTGDRVIVESQLTTKEIEVKATELLHPDCVWVPSAYGGFSKKAKTAYGVGINYNDFLPVMVEPIAGSVMGQEIIVKVRKG